MAEVSEASQAVLVKDERAAEKTVMAEAAYYHQKMERVSVEAVVEPEVSEAEEGLGAAEVIGGEARMADNVSFHN